MPPKTTKRKQMARAPAYVGGTKPPAGYYNQFLQNVSDLHKVQGVTPTPYTKTPWQGQYEPLPTQGAKIGAPEYRQKTKTPGVYKPPMPTATGDFITDWRNTVPRDNTGMRHGVGPGGEELPRGAVGWDNNGEPYYGDGARGWWNELKSNMLKPEDEPTGGVVARASDPFGSAFETYGNLIDKAKQYSAFRIPNALLKSGLTAVGEFAKETERVYGAAEGVEEAGKGSPLPEIPSEGFRLGAGKLPLLNINIPEIDFDYLVHANPAAFAYNALRLATSPKTPDEKWQNITDSYQAGRVMYSAAMDPLIREEYIRRYQAGENPYLLATELEHPVAEMVGQMINDPLNFIPNFSKFRQAGQMVSKLDDFAKIPDDVARVLKAGAGAANDTEAIQFMSKATEAIKAAKLNRLANLEDFAKSTGWNKLLARGKAFTTHMKTSEFLQAVTSNAKSSDEALDWLKGVYLLASDDVNDIETGLLMIRKSPVANMLLSERGTDAGIVLREMIGDSPTKFLNELKEAKTAAKTPEEALLAVNDLVNSKLQKATEKMFPTMTQRMKAAEDPTKVGQKLGLIPASEIKKLPLHTQSLIKFHESAQKIFFKPFNTFASVIYLGMSPAYAFRNLANNVVTAMIDEGPQAVFGGAKRAAQYMQDILGHAPVGSAMDIKGFTKAPDTLNVPKAFRFASDQANKFEEWTSTMVSAAAVRRAYRKMMRPGLGIPDMTPLLQNGFTIDETNGLFGLIYKNNGNIRKALDEFKQMAASGGLDVVKSDLWLSKLNKAPGEDVNVLARIREIAEDSTKTLDEKNVAIDALLKEHEDIALKTAAEARGINLENLDPVTGMTSEPLALEASESLGGANNLKELGDGGDEMWQAATDYFNANSYSNESYSGFLNQWLDVNWQSLDPQLRNRLRTTAQMVTSPEYRQTKALHQERLNNWLYHRKIALGETARPEGWTFESAWKAMGMDTPIPSDKTKFLERGWHEYYFPYTRQVYNDYRDWLAQFVEEAVASNPSVDTRMLDTARMRHLQAQALDIQLRDDEVRKMVLSAVSRSDNAAYARAKAYQYGIPAATEKGVSLDKKLLNIVNANLPEGAQPFEKLSDVPTELSDTVFAQHLTKNVPTPGAAESAIPTGQMDFLEQAPAPLPPAATAQMPSGARNYAESLDGWRKYFADVKTALSENHGKVIPVTWTKEKLAALEKYGDAAMSRWAEAKLLIADSANEARKFTLHNYAEKYGIDLALSYIYPYHFWYSRTYLNWMKRVAQHPGVIAGYAKYKEAMAKIHAGAPEWWKYNINSNELLGIESDNPLFFNLEATLNPLNGLTGTDFNDPDKRINWWTESIDNLGKFGPSIWTPYNYAVALALMMQGEEEAASRWGGRLIPQTASLKNMLSLANINIPTRQGVNEFDPAVLLMNNGVDPYEGRRAGRSLGALVDNGEIDQETALEAARTQSGPVWRMALEHAIRQRAGNPLLAVSNFMLGTGFKARNITDMQIDRMDQEWRFLWGRRDTMSPEKFQQEMDALKERYPFLDTVILARKSGVERDESYAYNVLSRIPPGQKDDAAEMVGLNPDLISEFYDTKGAALEGWAQPEKDKFMASIVELGAILALPDNATRREWNMAKDLYKDVDIAIEKQWGDDITDKITTYYAFKDDYRSRDAYLEQHPEVQEALEYKDYIFNNNPLLRQYYGSFDKVSKYYNSLMYDDLEKRYGDVNAMQATYRDLQLQDAEAKANFEAAHPELDTTAKQTKYKNEQLKAAHPELDTTAKLNAYKKAHPNWDGDNAAGEFKESHPEIDEYYRVRDEYEQRIADVLSELAKKVKEPVYQFRDVTPETTGEANLMAEANAPGVPEVYNYTRQDFEGMMSPTLWRLTLDNVLEGEELSRAAEDQLEYIAGDLNISMETLLELIGDSMR